MIVVFFFLASQQGDLSNHYTDHLRHMGEAVALVKRGFQIYSLPYRQAIEGLRLPCPEHVGLWDDQPIPYPPLGILLHWPTAELESQGLVSPWLSHRLTVTLWLALACAACMAAWMLFAQQPKTARVGLWFIFVPLTIGIGANGFYDTAYILCAVLALLFVQRQKFASSLILFALSIALHFRALVFAPMMGIIARQLWIRERRRVLRHFAMPILLLAPAAAAAWVVHKNAGAFYPHNPVHYSHHSVAFAALGLVSLASGAILIHLRQYAATATIAASWLMTVLDPLHGWWHAAVLTAPGLVLASSQPEEPHLARLGWFTTWGWAVLGGYCAFRHPLTPYWQWVDFAIRGVH